MTTAAPATVEASLLRDVLEHLHEDRYRLVLADWWEEHGQEERAEFVRVQVESAGLRCDRSHEGCQRAVGLEAPWCAPCVRRARLFFREREHLRPGEVRRWLVGVPWEHAGVPYARHEGDGVCRLFHSPNPDNAPDWSVTFHRGFVEDVTLPCADFLAHARELFSAQPVLRVTLSDREPYEERPRDASGRFVSAGTTRYYWGRIRLGRPAVGSPALLPAPLYAACVAFSFDSREEALAALSDACVAWGRAEADLPPLPG